MVPGRRSLRRKLMAVLMMTSLMPVLLTCAVFIVYEVTTFRRTMVESLSTRAAILAANCTASLAFENRDDAAEVLGALRNDTHMEVACLYDREGRLFVAYPVDSPPAAFPRTIRDEGARFAGSHVEIFAPVVQNGRPLGTLYLESNLQEMAERFRLYGIIVLVVITASTVLAYVLARSFQGRISRPILAIVETARSVSEKRDYSARAPRLSDDEIGVLADGFNQMLAQIQERDEWLSKLNLELEQRVRERTTRLETANRELEAFSYSVAHDLRAPLRSIDGFSQALLEDCADKLDEEGKAYLGNVRESAQQMAQLIDDLLGLSRLSRAELSRSRIDLTDIARAVVARLQRDHPDRMVEFVVPEGVAAVGDERLLGIVLENLLGNAWKFTSKRSQARIEFGQRCEDGHSVYFIRDNGDGFDMAYVRKLFGVFQRLHSASEFEGTGIGLATVQRIIHRHGGRVWAEGEVDRGATFYFTLEEGT